jgi:pilus assembly protein Flp/PilA
MEFMMSKIVSAVKAFVADEDGVTAIEYGLIAALVGVAIITAVSGVGTELSNKFDEIKDKLVAS